MSQPWSLVVPVKQSAVAKSRLADTVGPARAALALAMAADTVAAAAGAQGVAAVVVVTDDPSAAAELAALGVTVVPDAPDAGLNPALEHGIAHARLLAPDRGVAVLSADVPALRPGELARVLAAAQAYPSAFLADAAGIGTTVYTLAPGVPAQPRFGGRSRAAHRESGAVEIHLEGVTSVRRDVDDAVGLWDALRLGVGPRTAAVVASLDVPIPGVPA